MDDKSKATKNPQPEDADKIAAWRPPKHFCSICGKPRSRKFYESSMDKQTRDKGICSRLSCAKFKNTSNESHQFKTVILEVHHYLHGDLSLASGISNDAVELPGQSCPPRRAEMPDGSRYLPYRSHYASRTVPIVETPPPLVNRLTKPELHF